MNPHQSKWLWFLTLSYVMINVMTNWFDARLISLYGIITDAGTLIFPLTFLLSDLITEVYGYKFARRAIWCGFLFNILFLLYGQLIIHLPDPPFNNNNSYFAIILATNSRIIVASLISYILSEPLNSYLMAKLKLRTQGKYLAGRFISSTFFASLVDSIVFSTIAFYNVMPLSELYRLIFTMWLIKVVIEILGLPLSIYLTKQLKNSEKIDIYDSNTQFNLFSLNTQYQKENNHF